MFKYLNLQIFLIDWLKCIRKLKRNSHIFIFLLLNIYFFKDLSISSFSSQLSQLILSLVRGLYSSSEKPIDARKYFPPQKFSVTSLWLKFFLCLFFDPSKKEFWKVRRRQERELERVIQFCCIFTKCLFKIKKNNYWLK